MPSPGTAAALFNLPFPTSEPRLDIIFWKPNSCGAYSVRSAYRLYRQLDLARSEDECSAAGRHEGLGSCPARFVFLLGGFAEMAFQPKFVYVRDWHFWMNRVLSVTRLQRMHFHALFACVEIVRSILNRCQIVFHQQQRLL